MRRRLQTKYPTLIILYIPANCTSEIQPLDVDFNGPFKKMVKTEATRWLAKEIAAVVARGAAPSEVRVATGKRDLVKPFCSWLESAFFWASGEHVMLQRAWSRSGISVAWDDLAKRATLLREAAQLEASGVLWKCPTKEEPLLADVLDMRADDLNQEEEEEEEALVACFDDDEEEEKDEDSEDNEDNEDLNRFMDFNQEAIQRLAKDLGDVRRSRRERKPGLSKTQAADREAS